MSDLVERVAKAICAEKCAYRGEPSCAVVMKGTAYRFPPETCCEPGCLAEARAACAIVLEDAAKVADKYADELVKLRENAPLGDFIGSWSDYNSRIDEIDDIAAAIRKLGEE